MDLQVGGMIGVLLVLADLWALLHVAASEPAQLRRIVWSAVVVLLPGLGLIAWLVAGPRVDTAIA